jgi:alpha-mannosidase
LKRDIRAAELAAIDVGGLVRRRGFRTPRGSRTVLDESWRTVCFNQFHDILPGSAIAEAVDAQRAQVGGARSRLDELAFVCLRHPGSRPRQDRTEGHRLHIVNRVSRAWRGLVEADLWLKDYCWAHHFEDEQGRLVASQPIESPATMAWDGRCVGPPQLLLPLALKKGESRVLRICAGLRDEEASAALAGETPAFKLGVLSNGLAAVRFGRSGVASVRALPDDVDLLSAPPALQCIEDCSDTWSHGLARFDGPVLSEARFGTPCVVETGCLLTMVRLNGRIGASAARLFVWLERGDPSVHFRLDVNYQERHSVLKVRFACSGGCPARLDRVAGGWIDRAADGREVPVQHATTGFGGARRLGLVLPDTFAMDGTGDAVRPTLIRNSIHAMDGSTRERIHAHPRLGERFGTDEGPQRLRFSLSWDDAAAPAALESLLDCRQRQPWLWDDYHGISRVGLWELLVCKD